ncbi:MAG: flagellar biosynthetic protein FliQ [Actinomycetia bacterium]|nr:flagellar biosynthetic protein FliQ [Actinomycetes bacterium]MCP3911094.1 flagellar biosynthetic protein FliQ [Actinomycetes bacterium]MCP4085651.1 flagellar biosynthetic protein FliQ [Actinomycetes bacterium]
MSEAAVLDIAARTLWIAAKLAGPFLVTSLAVGVAIGLVQSITQLQEQTLTFVPKFVATGVVVIVAGSWMLNEMVFFTQELLDMVPDLVH